MPTRPRDQTFDLLIEPWRFPKQQLYMEPLASWRAARGNPTLEHRRVTVISSLDHVVRFHAHYDPVARHDLYVYSIEFFPGAAPTATDLRVPFAAYLRVVRYAIAHATHDSPRYELRDGRLYEEAFVTGPLAPAPPPRRHPREPRKRVDLDEVARVYLANPKRPTQAVARHFGLTWRTAARRVADARAAKKLPAS